MNDQLNNESWTYDFDRGGNILGKKRYGYTTGTLGSPNHTPQDPNLPRKRQAFNGTIKLYQTLHDYIQYLNFEKGTVKSSSQLWTPFTMSRCLFIQ